MAPPESDRRSSAPNLAELERPEPPLDRDGFNRTDASLLVAIAALCCAVGTPWYLHSRKSSNEAYACGALKTITTCQCVFREGDKEQDGNLDYGMLSELSNVTLIDSVLGSGTKDGYFFEATYSYLTSEFLWFAIANPRLPKLTGDRYFTTTAAGVLFYTTQFSVVLDTNTCLQPVNGFTPLSK